MSSVHLARQGFITKATLPSVSRERGTTSTADNRTVLLLNGNGTNGKQNNTFVTDNFGSAGGQGNYSVAFDGTGDYLEAPDNDAFSFGSGDFTIEGWVYLNANPVIDADGNYISALYTQQQSSPTNSKSALFYLQGTSSSYTSINFTGSSNNTTSTNITGSFSFALNTWYHVACVRNGNNVYLYVNGTQVNSTTAFSLTLQNSTVTPKIGAALLFSGFNYFWYLNGYMSNFRIVKGTAVYTSAFTPPTSELTAISGTSLLTCQGTVIRDASSNNFAITANGDAKVATNTSSAPIAITRNGNATQGSYSPFTLPDGQWSNYFDGSGDFLSFTGVNSAFEFGTGDFTVECWVNPSATPADAYIWDFRPTSNNGAWASLDMQSSKFIYVANSAARITGTTVPVVGRWYHVAISRSGTSTRMFVNGVQEGSTYTDSTNYVVGSGRPYIGTDSFGNTFPFTGYISNFRILKGTAAYTTTFTPPTTPLTAITNTSLLTCQSNRFRDNSSNNFAITRNGDVRVTPWSPFEPSSAYDPATNGGSGYFDGTGDYLSVPAISTLATSFTIEFWAYFSNADNTRFDFFGLGGSAVLYRPTGNTLNWYIGSDRISGSFTQATHGGRWNHIAICRDSSNNTRLFVNGTQLGSTYTSDTSTYSSTGPTIGWNSGGNHVNGYISNFRIVNGTAVYTSAFTPPTAPVTNITNTSLLLNFTNAGIFDAAGDNVIETVGNAQIDTAVKKYGTGALEFDGSGDGLLIPNTPDINFDSGDFTLECWVYTNNTTSEVCVLGKGWQQSGAVYASYLITRNTTQLRFLASSNGSSWDIANEKVIGTISANTWTHVAVTRQGTTFRAFVDGVLNSSFTFTSSSSLVNNANQRLHIGCNSTSGANLNGYLDDIRITKGQARYTATFTPPTAELAIFGTVPNIVNNSTYGVYQLA